MTYNAYPADAYTFDGEGLTVYFLFVYENVYLSINK